MSDPERWTSDPDAPEGVAELFAAGKKASPPMPPEVRARVGATLAALAAGGVATAPSTAAAAKAASSTIASSGLFKITLAVVLSITGAAVFHFSRAAAPAHPAQPAAVEAAPAEAPARPVEAPVPAPIEAEVAAPAEAEVAAPAARPLPRPVTPTVLDPLADEARLISEAHAVLEAQPARALALTTTHRRLYAEGQLAAERELVAIDALMRLGRADAARTRAARLEAHYPSSPYSARAQRILARAAESAAESDAE